MSWHQWMPRRWRNEQEIARRFMTGVKAGYDLWGRAVVRGDFPLRGNYGTIRDRFKIRVVYPEDFLPLGPRVGMVSSYALHPAVYLDSHHDVWERDVDGHILLGWKLCLYVPGESGIDFTLHDASIKLYEALHRFLILQRIYQRDLKRQRETGIAAKWPGPQRTHGPEGYWEAVRDRGGMADDEACICGSGVRYDECHKFEVALFEVHAA